MDMYGVICVGMFFHLIGIYADKEFPPKSNRVIRTQFGKLRAMLITLPNRHLPQVECYRSLQFASTRGKDLRFMPPTAPSEKWDRIRLATIFRPVCPQRLPNIAEMKKKLPLGRVGHFERILPFLKNQSEDCLNLNVYVPLPEAKIQNKKIQRANHTSPMPVVVLIHGETYEMGTGNAYDGSVLAAFGRVVVVTINYRLGVLGFLTTGDSNAPGNCALLDQVAALHWVKQNIADFGGDPRQVTLLGQGYGAAMVNLLMISPVTRGKNLFKQAIIESGSALSTWAVTTDPIRYTREIAEKVNCSRYLHSNTLLMRCFKDKDWKDLTNVDIQAPKYFTAFGPVVDRRSVLPKDVVTMFKTSPSVFDGTNLLLGVMKNEGFHYFSENDIHEGVSEHRKEKIVRTYVRNIYHYHRQKIYEILMHHYSNWERPKDPEVIRDDLMELLGDGQITAPLIDLARYHATHSDSKTFLYSFSYPSRLDTYPRWAGGVHGDDMTYVFGAPLTDKLDPFNSSYTRSEKMLTEAVMTYWINFIKSGDPNKPLAQESLHGGRAQNRFQKLDWPTFDNDKQQYLHIGMRPTVRNHYRATRMALWLDLIPKLHKSDSLDPVHHLLDNYANESSFEDEGTRQLDLKEIFPLLTPSTTTTSTTSTTRRPTTTTTTTTPLPTTPSTIRGFRERGYVATRNPSNRWRKNTTPRMATSISPATGVLSGKDSTLSLSVTIAVGCSLLFLNILIFAGVYYQKDRMRTELKMRKRELEQEKEAQMQDSDNYMKSSTGPETDTNSSSMPTPPAGPNFSRHQLSPHHIVASTLGKPTIPIYPPHAPHSMNARKSSRSLSTPLDHMENAKLKRSASPDSEHGLSNHHGNPSTVV